jgi:hypothetical protein
VTLQNHALSLNSLLFFLVFWSEGEWKGKILGLLTKVKVKGVVVSEGDAR